MWVPLIVGPFDVGPFDVGPFDVISGDVVSHFYDPMIAKLVVWSEDRTSALKRLTSALHSYQVYRYFSLVNPHFTCTPHFWHAESTLTIHILFC